MKDIIIGLFGVYVPLMQDVYQEVIVDGAVTTVPAQIPVYGVAGLDIAWIAGAFLFAITLWSLFKIIGVVISRV